ncbi:MAG: complex I subunit 1 family protein [Euryarchaeota archaeon]|nr:complex I subunit 1 family protein [Euryarchaeota archaeon]
MILILKTLIGSCGIALFGIIFGLLYKGIDRKLHAHMQMRVGPPITQPFKDVRKLFLKDSLVPENAVGWVFNLMPILSLASVITILLYIPLGSEPILSTKGDMILILYLLMLPAICLIIGGFASSSPYATVGAQREMVAMISYEFPLAVTIIGIVWRLNKLYPMAEAFSLDVMSSNPLWNDVGVFGILGLVVLLGVLLIVTPLELSKIPFDVPEAETEIAGGLLVEYSGKNLGMFYMADAVKTIVMASIVVALFFPYGLSQYFELSQYLNYVIDFVFFLIKAFAVILVSVTVVRTSFARLKIDQIARMFWVQVTLISLIGLVLLYLDVVL